jgi:hypothetical protein
MADHIPFVNGITDYETFRAHYHDSCMVRMPLEKINRIRVQRRENTPLWIDPGIDGYEHYCVGENLGHLGPITLHSSKRICCSLPQIA